MELVKLDERWKGTKLRVVYQSEGFYDAVVKNSDDELSISFVKKKYPQPRWKGFEDELFGDWLHQPIVWGYHEQDKLIGCIELCHEVWNNRMRISNIYVDSDYRRKGLGQTMMDKAVEIASAMDCRALILETQSCNLPAIRFYRKNKFKLAGCDLNAYTNFDVEQEEVRLEFYRILHNHA